MAATIPPRWAFLRLWFLLFFSYGCVKFIFNLGMLGYIDLRPIAIYELLLVPLGQSAVFWWVTRRGRRHRTTQATDAPQ